MRLFKPRFRDRATGQQRETQKWYCDFLDHRQIRRRIPAERCATERQAAKFGEMIESLVVARQYGDKPDRKLADWLHGLPKSTLRKLAEIGLVDAEYVTATLPLSQHIRDFEAWLRDTKARHGYKRNESYVHNVVTEVEYIIRECGCTHWPELTKAAVESCLGKLDVASKTFNMYLAGIKLFGAWMVENGRAADSPVAKIDRVRWQKTEARRALTEAEARRLLTVTATGAAHHGMTGLDRAVLYLTAIETGFRSNELRALTVGCFDFDNATVTLAPEHCKNRCEAVQYIKRARAEHFRAYLAGKAPGEKVFRMPPATVIVAMLRQDLTAAGIKPTDERGVKVVFHSLRYTLATALDKTGATVKERMAILRHSDKGSLTLGVYTTLQIVDLRGAIEKLPDYAWPGTVQRQSKREVA